MKMQQDLIIESTDYEEILGLGFDFRECSTEFDPLTELELPPDANFQVKESLRSTIWRQIVFNIRDTYEKINRKVLWNLVKTHPQFKEIGTNEKRRNYREMDFYKWLNENFKVVGKKKKAYFVYFV